LRHWIILIFFSMKIKHFHRSWVYTTHKIKSYQFIARMIALICNGWNLFVRLAIPHKHHVAITSRPLLLSSIGRLTEHGRQKKMLISSTHGDITTLKSAYI
ncbi:MAG: hypothetical protein LC437_01770, partial [Thiohalomonas sp.]|nr:hypothetical protein [Thiohalomonas sp.]